MQQAWLQNWVLINMTGGWFFDLYKLLRHKYNFKIFAIPLFILLWSPGWIFDESSSSWPWECSFPIPLVRAKLVWIFHARFNRRFARSAPGTLPRKASSSLTQNVGYSFASSGRPLSDRYSPTIVVSPRPGSLSCIHVAHAVSITFGLSLLICI